MTPRTFDPNNVDDHYILIGQTPVEERNLLAWARWFEENNESRRVACTEAGNIRISTVFLGLDHRHFGEGPPLLFETMSFCDGESIDQERCSTWSEAEQMHTRMVGRIKEKANVR